MWQAPNQRVRGVRKSRNQDRLVRPFHIKRIVADITSSAAPGATEGQSPSSVQARLLLNDLSPKGMGCFSREVLTVDDEVTIRLGDPAAPLLHGRVVYCQTQYGHLAVITESPYSHRVGIQFAYSSPEDEAAMKKYCDDLVCVLMPVAA